MIIITTQSERIPDGVTKTPLYKTNIKAWHAIKYAPFPPTLCTSNNKENNTNRIYKQRKKGNNTYLYKASSVSRRLRIETETHARINIFTHLISLPCAHTHTLSHTCYGCKWVVRSWVYVCTACYIFPLYTHWTHAFTQQRPLYNLPWCAIFIL